MSQICKYYDHHEFHLLVGSDVVHGQCKKFSPSIIESELHEVFLTVALLTAPLANINRLVCCVLADGSLEARWKRYGAVIKRDLWLNTLYSALFSYKLVATIAKASGEAAVPSYAISHKL